MKIKIDKTGNLHVDGRMKMCPFKVTNEHYTADLTEELPKNRELEWRASTPCGDWCALFNIYKGEHTIHTELCHRRYLINLLDFTNEREAQ